jgi:hypothetical protein
MIKPKVSFLCTANSSRTQMAEGFLRSMAGERFEVYSAGGKPGSRRSGPGPFDPGIGHAIGKKWVFNPHYGVMVSKRFHHNRPPTILDVPVNLQWAALDIPDPETPVGARVGDCGI